MTEPTKCPHCGSEIHEGASFCLFCMRTLTKKMDITPTVHYRRRRAWIPVLCMVCILIAAAMIVLCYRIGTPGVTIQDNSYETDDAAMRTNSIFEQSDITENSLNDPQASETNFETTVASPSENIQNEHMNPSSEPTTGTASENNIPSDITHDDKPSSGTDITESAKVEVTTTPVVTDPPVACMHSYSDATCVSPKICTLCGASDGDILLEGHNWVGHTRIIQHEEVGHWEDVYTHSVKEIRYTCFFCGYQSEYFASYDAVRAHMPVHSHKADYQYVLSKIESLSEKREVWTPVYETQWIVDQEAYTETITEYSCSYCGKNK